MSSSRVALVTNIPAPYRSIQFDAIGTLFGDNFCVFYAAKNEPNREWVIPELRHQFVFLRQNTLKFFPRQFYLNSDIFCELRKYNPDIVITAGFNPTMLFAFWFSLLKKKKHIMFTDSWLHPVNQLSVIHKIVRKIIIKKSQAFICISTRGKEYLIRYGAKKNCIFISRLVIDNEYYSKFLNNYPFYDVMFSGQFIERKQPLFFCNVVEILFAKKKGLKVLIIGNGPLREKMLTYLNNIGVQYYYPGFIQQPDLPNYYANSKVLLFPTLDDPWGIVANEALAVGTPVITSDNSGAAYDMILPGETGFIIDLKPDLWAEKCLELINNPQILKNLKANCISHIQNYSIKASAEGFIKAIDFAAQN